MSRARIGDIITLASNLSGISIASIKGASRIRALVHIRSAISIVARRHGHTTSEIGRALDRDHSSIVHVCQRGEAWKASTPELGEFIEILATEAEDVKPFIAARRKEAEAIMSVLLVLPKPVPKPKRTKPKNDFGPGKFVSDDSHKFHANIAIGSARLAAAIAEARAA